MINFIHEMKKQLDKISPEDTFTLQKTIQSTDGKILILGNGGSNAISSHIAEDYTKVLKKPSMSFSDGPRLTCYANDYGYENAFKHFLMEFSDKQGLVILISSSGNSKNILNCADYCIENKLRFLSFSGFSPNNRLRSISTDKAILNIWVDSSDYGIVELVHETILHSIVS